MLLQLCDNLSQALQTKTISAAEGQHLGKMVIDTLQGMRKDKLFDLFWEKVCGYVESFDVEQAQLPRKRKFPHRYDDGMSSGNFIDSPKLYYRQLYYEAINVGPSNKILTQLQLQKIKVRLY